LTLQDCAEARQSNFEPGELSISMERDDEETEQSEDESEDESRPVGGFFRRRAEGTLARADVGEVHPEAAEKGDQGAILSDMKEDKSNMEI
jgi:hypothetical protein